MKIAHEKRAAEAMIRLYCRKNHNTKDDLCESCGELLDYAKKRLDGCRFGDAKPFCQACRVHCYKPQKRELIRQVMRYSGKRMIFSHPIVAIRHLAGRIWGK